jgi:hypothetical protein
MSAVRHRLIFCINSGRSGSQYLAELLATAKDVYAAHEADPDMSGRYLSMVCKQGPENTYSARCVKAKAIRKILGEHPDGTVYAETNHMFIKTFDDVIMRQFENYPITVVVLRRHLASVLKSFVAMGYFSDRNEAWPSWMPLPGSCGSEFQPPVLDRNPDQYELAIGYLIDIEARAQQFRRRYPFCQVHDIRLESLQDPSQVQNLFRELQLEPGPQTVRVAGRPVNQRTRRKVEIGIETTLEYCEQRISEYLRICSEQGVRVPALSQISESNGVPPDKLPGGD